MDYVWIDIPFVKVLLSKLFRWFIDCYLLGIHVLKSKIIYHFDKS